MSPVTFPPGYIAPSGLQQRQRENWQEMLGNFLNAFIQQRQFQQRLPIEKQRAQAYQTQAEAQKRQAESLARARRQPEPPERPSWYPTYQYLYKTQGPEAAQRYMRRETGMVKPSPISPETKKLLQDQGFTSSQIENLRSRPEILNTIRERLPQPTAKITLGEKEVKQFSNWTGKSPKEIRNMTNAQKANMRAELQRRGRTRLGEQLEREREEPGISAATRETTRRTIRGRIGGKLADIQNRRPNAFTKPKMIEQYRNRTGLYLDLPRKYNVLKEYERQNPALLTEVEQTYLHNIEQIYKLFRKKMENNEIKWNDKTLAFLNDADRKQMTKKQKDLFRRLMNIYKGSETSLLGMGLF